MSKGCYVCKSAAFYESGAFPGYYWEIKDEGDDGVELIYHDKHMEGGKVTFDLSTTPAVLRKMGLFLVEIAESIETQNKEMSDAV